MGMFDVVIVPSNWLPLSRDDRFYLLNTQWQTKDLDRTMNRYFFDNEKRFCKSSNNRKDILEWRYYGSDAIEIHHFERIENKDVWFSLELDLEEGLLKEVKLLRRGDLGDLNSGRNLT